jgi:hypothetical protein
MQYAYINNPKKHETEVTVYNKYVSQILFMSFETRRQLASCSSEPEIVNVEGAQESITRNRLQGIDSARLGIDSSAL